MKLNHATRNRVTVRRALALLINIRLDSQALTRLVGVLQVLANFDNCERNLVTEACGINSQIAIIEFGMTASLLQDFHIGETNADRIDSHEQLIISGFRNEKRFWFS